MKRFIDMEQSPLSMFLLFINLVCVQSVNEYYFIYHFSGMIKDFSISFSKVITFQDFVTVTFYLLFVYKPTFSVIRDLKQTDVAAERRWSNSN